MGTTTTTFTLTVQAESNPLATLAASMSPTSWSNEIGVYLGENVPGRPGDATKINDLVGYDGTGLLAGGKSVWQVHNDGNSTTLLGGDGGPNKSHWDSTTKRWFHFVGSTGQQPYAQGFVRYDSVRDEFRAWKGSSSGATDGPVHPYGGPHSFGASCIDLINRRMWRGMQQVSPWNTAWPYGESQLVWVSLDDPTVWGTAGSRYYSAQQFSRPIEFAPQLGSQGSVIVFRNTDAYVCKPFVYDIATGVWDFTTWPTAGQAGPQCIALVGNYFYVAADIPATGLKRFARLDLIGKQWETLQDTPVIMNSGGGWRDDPSQHTEFAAIGTKIYAFYAGASGSDGAIYVFDTETLTWDLTPVDTLPPREAGWGTTEANRQSYTVTAVPEYGIVLLAMQKTDFTDVALAWKP